MDWLIVILPLMAGWVMDLLLGDPAWLPHPVVGFGKMISLFEKRLNRGGHRVLKGVFAAVFLIGVAFAGAWWILSLLAPFVWIKVAVEAILIFYCLAGNTLIKEVREVFRACDISIKAGRIQVGRIVGRDTASLTPQEVRTAALETLAENLSDGVIAPLFWYLLLGVPGMLAYKMVNTLDSMIGYRNERYYEFGRAAARTDDVANYIPARLTALLMLIGGMRLNLLGFVWEFGGKHLSPNSGYPEAALAGILNCRFGGTHDYFGEAVYKPYIGRNEKILTTADMLIATAVNRRSEILMVLLCAGSKVLHLLFCVV